MSGLPSFTILSEEQKFNRNNLLQWKTNITQLLGSKGLLGYIDGKIPKPPSSSTSSDSAIPTPTPTATPIYLTTPTLDEWIFQDQLTRGHITLNCTDVAGLGIITTRTAKDAWDSIKNEWGKSTDTQQSHAQEALNQTLYNKGTNIQEHIKLIRTHKAVVDNLGTEIMTDETWRGILIWLIPPTAKWLPVIPSLYSMSSSADVVSTLITHRMILGRETKPGNASHLTTALATQTKEGCTNPNCKVKKCTTHTTPNCYWPGGGKEGQFPPNFRQRSKANAATTTATPNASTPNTSTPNTITPGQTDHFVLSAQTPITPGRLRILTDGLVPEKALIDDLIDHPHTALISRGFQSFRKGKVPTFMDSGASDTMFVSRDEFSKYQPIIPRIGDSAKAIDGGFKIVGEGNVVQ